MDNKELGKLGEEFTSKLLVRKGYRIICRNFSCKFGEIDIVAVKNDILYFCEVKTRQNLNFGVPSDAVTAGKRMHMKNAASYYMQLSRYNYMAFEFKVIEILINEIDEVFI
ncbi:MAG: YraN family protein [Clostridia bacterium]|nr:YraN family protein [Clostridia bacterium]